MTIYRRFTYSFIYQDGYREIGNFEKSEVREIGSKFAKYFGLQFYFERSRTSNHRESHVYITSSFESVTFVVSSENNCSINRRSDKCHVF